MSMMCKAWPPKPILKTKNQKIMEKERKITAPEGFEIEKVELIDGVAVVTFREKERKLPKTWEEFCKMFPVKNEEFYVSDFSNILNRTEIGDKRHREEDKNMLPDRATAEAVLALCQLIQLRNAYNGDWVPKIGYDDMYTIDFPFGEICEGVQKCMPEVLMFKSSELCDEFLRNFRPLIEKLKPLYGIREGGEE